MSSFKLGSLLDNVVSTKMDQLHNFLQFDTELIEKYLSKNRTSNFSSYYDRKAKILGNLHGILIEDPEGIFVNPSALSKALLRREKFRIEDRIHHELESIMKENFQAFDIARNRSFEEIINKVEKVIKKGRFQVMHNDIYQ